MTRYATESEYDTYAGRDAAGRPSDWLLRHLEGMPAVDSLLPTSLVASNDETQFVLRTLPRHQLARAEELIAESMLDNEIRALVRLSAHYPAAAYPAVLPKIVGYEFDTAEPFVLLKPYLGAPCASKVRGLLTDDRRRFMIGMFRALAQLSVVGLVHGNVGISCLRWDGSSVQLVSLEHAVPDGEPYRHGRSGPGSTRSVAHVGDDIWSAGLVVHELMTGRRPVRPDRAPDLSDELAPLANLLRGVFEPSPLARPTPQEMLRRLGANDNVVQPSSMDERLRQGRERFDLLKPVDHPRPRTPAPPAQQPRRAAVPSRRTPSVFRRPLVLGIAVLTLLAVTVLVVVMVTR